MFIMAEDINSLSQIAFEKFAFENRLMTKLRIGSEIKKKTAAFLKNKSNL